MPHADTIDDGLHRFGWSRRHTSAEARRLLTVTDYCEGALGAAAHPIHECALRDSVLEERFAVALRVDRIRSLA